MEWRADAGGQTMVLASEGGIPSVVYWGPRLPEAEDLAQIAAASLNDLTGGMIDRLPALSLCPESGRAFQGQPGLVLSAADGSPLHPAFTLTHAEEAGHAISFISTAPGLRLIHRIEAAGDVFLLMARLESEAPVRVAWLAAPVLPAPQSADEMIDLSGRWIGEFRLNRVSWTPGIRLREARTGRSGHEHPPYAIFPERGCLNTRGTAHALHYAWSGGHRMVAEELPDGRRQIQFGHAAGAETRPGTRFETAPLIAAFSDAGLNGIGTAFQRDILDRVIGWPDPTRPRPVHYNCWEAIYFDHNLANLAAIADRAAEIGAERFVLDDGWFGRRDDDTSSLGDWVVDRRKWPDGLHPLITHVHRLGMTFGLWFEPEMVNPDSDLMRAHPDWMLGPADQVTGRNQMVLDMANSAVRDHLFAATSAILTEYPIDYIKWDHNRLLPVVDAAQTRGTYDLLDRLRAAHPAVEIESCASGGGRIDAGILARTHRVWLSDSNDALERLRMQHDAALFLPAAVTGSHVGPRKSHTSGRVLPMSFRARVAAQRHMGFEMDLRELTEDEAATLHAVTAWWKDNRAWLMTADILRLDSDDPAVIAEMQLARDGARFVVTAGQAEAGAQILPRPLRLTGLEPDARYRVELSNPADAPPQSRGPNALKSAMLTLTGRALMAQGLLLPVAWPGTLWVVEGTRLP
ncbi:alpha-galactosidase [Aliigemmobacter aestuarii]|uniref:alpha-galactosidase n=1 Tax=Aliigemmobacter aestuarii TaxID=1445661 RepID=A0A4S3MU83_9RHOB|nr:alpha-galactosidase [Gemmobacter aestuarii]THD85723.1 alpha-galactosidase [Gemmobacter aestuarii]